MLLTLSPSKRLADCPRFPPEGVTPTTPRLLAEAAALARRARRFSKAELAATFRVSDELTSLNRARFRAWCEPAHDPANPPGAERSGFQALMIPFPTGSGPTRELNACPAALLFEGDVYDGLNAGGWSPGDWEFADRHVRILSGLYGLLRPGDLILPHRLEMGTKFPAATRDVPRTLYAFWGDRLADLLRADLAELDGPPVLLDLASREYAKAAPLPDVRTVTPRFLEEREDGPPRVVALFAKRARGAFAGWVVRNRVTDPGRLPEFAALDYRFAPDLSGPDAPMFTRRSIGVRKRP